MDFSNEKDRLIARRLWADIKTMSAFWCLKKNAFTDEQKELLIEYTELHEETKFADVFTASKNKKILEEIAWEFIAPLVIDMERYYRESFDRVLHSKRHEARKKIKKFMERKGLWNPHIHEESEIILDF